MKKKIPLTYPLDRWLGFGLALLLFTFAACNNAPAPKEVKTDPPCAHDGYPLPFMWVPKQQSIDRKILFKKKHDLLMQTLQAPHPNKVETDSIDFDITSFRGMLDHVETLHDIKRVDAWIAAYDDDGSIAVPPTLGNTLTIVFTPVNSGDQIVEYYTLKPGTTGFNLGQNGLTQKMAEGWINNYAVLKMPALLKDLDPHDVNNNVDGVLSDTRAMHYDRADIFELRKEIDHQKGTNGVTITGVRAYFSAIADTGDTKGNFKNRLLLQYEFLRKSSTGKDTVFFLEDGADWCDRSGPPRHLDNGQMCPPSCQPPPPPPPTLRAKSTSN